MPDQPSEDNASSAATGADAGVQDAPSLEEVDSQIAKARHALEDVEGTGERQTFMGDELNRRGPRDEQDAEYTDDTIVPPG